jgi:Concanavalin A-like lectin/glucanases superfamily
MSVANYYLGGLNLNDQAHYFVDEQGADLSQMQTTWDEQPNYAGGADLQTNVHQGNLLPGTVPMWVEASSKADLDYYLAQLWQQVDKPLNYLRVTPAVGNPTVELWAGTANGGTGPGINSPETTDWADTSRNGNDGTLVGFSTGRWGGTGNAADPYCILGNGTSQYVSLPDLGVAEDKVFTYESWTWCPGSAPGTYYALMGESGPTVTAYPLVMLCFNSAGRAMCFFRDGAGNTGHAYGPGSANLCDGYFRHLVAACDGSYTTVYVNGMAGTPVAVPAGSLALSWSSVMAAPGASGSHGYYYPGQFVSARMIPGTLSASWAAQNYAAGPVPTEFYTIVNCTRPSSIARTNEYVLNFRAYFTLVLTRNP